MIKIICVGKIKEKFYQDAVEEYLKRISKYGQLKIIEVKDYDYDNKNIVLAKEKIEIEKYIEEKDYVIITSIDGKKYSSVQFSDLMADKLIHYSNITFIIGGSYGLSEDVIKRGNEKISFSDFTFPHQLFRVIILEQIYRSYKILNNETYHK